MGWQDPEALADLTPIRSAAILWVIAPAETQGNRVLSLAQWSKALVAHMGQGLTPDLKAEIEERWPDLDYLIEADTPHNGPDEGHTDNGFAVSFPRPGPGRKDRTA